MARRPVLYGRLPVGVPAVWVPEADQHADRYPALQAFARHAGRTIAVVSHDEGDSPLVAAVHELFVRGEETVRVKVVARPKYGMYRVPRPATLALGAMREALWAECGYALEHLRRLPGAFLVQQEIPMRYEYRLFVVDGRPVTGAGCVDRHTPLDCRAAFDTAVERERGDGSVVQEPDIVATLVKFGATVASEVGVELPRLSEYALDVALGPDDQPLVVELNGLRNSGLYASDPSLVIAALRTQARGNG